MTKLLVRKGGGVYSLVVLVLLGFLFRTLITDSPTSSYLTHTVHPRDVKPHRHAPCRPDSRPLPLWANPSDNTSRMSRNAHSNLGHMTFLGPRAPPPCRSVFLYVYMPAPQVDTRETYLGHKQICEMIYLIDEIFFAHHWEETMTSAIRGILISQRQTISANVHHQANKLLSYINTVPRTLNEIHCSLSDTQTALFHLRSRRFPTERRQLTCQNCFPYEFKNIMAPKDLCKPGQVVNGVIIITTVPNNVKQRMVVRTTWGRRALMERYNYKVIFLFGDGWSQHQIDLLKTENAQHNDILMDDYFDNYYNLTQKVLMGFKWILRECPETQFVIRAADDTAINIEAVFTLIHDYGNDEAFQKHQVGHCFPAFQTYRSVDFKGYLNTLEYDRDVFPPYALGTVFVTSVNLTRELVDMSPHVPFVAIEDAYFGLVLEQLGRGCHHINGWLGRYTQHGV